MVNYDSVKIADTVEYYYKQPEELAAIREKGMQFAADTPWKKEAIKIKNALVELLGQMIM